MLFCLGCNPMVSSTRSTFRMFLCYSCRCLVCRMHIGRTLQVGTIIPRYQWRRSTGQDFSVSYTFCSVFRLKFVSLNIFLCYIFLSLFYFRVLGTPSQEEWPENVSLNWNAFPYRHPRPLSLIIPDLNEDGLDLIKNMLMFDPHSRITAAQAVRHRYFSEESVQWLFRKLSRLIAGLTSKPRLT